MPLFLARAVRHYLLSVQFFSRIPINGRLADWVGFSPAMLRASAAHFPGVGVLIGLLLTGFALGLSWLLPSGPMAPLVLSALVCTASLWLTGAFHEDGLADVADGLGGSFDRDRALLIMKDSRVGAYGAIAVAMALLSRVVLLAQLVSLATAGQMSSLGNLGGFVWVPVFFLSQVSSRAWPLLTIRMLPHVGDAAGSKSKPLADQISVPSLLVAGLWYFLRVPTSLRYTLPPVLAAFLVMAFMLFHTQRLQSAVAPLTLSIAFIHGYHCWVLYRHSEHKFGTRFLFYALLGLALCWLLRLVFDAAYPQWTDSALENGISTQLHAGLSVLRQITLIGFVLMASERIRDEFQRLASHDSLTGALLRRAWLLEAEREMARSQRHQRPLSLLAMDLDHFKQINDTLGHAAGDQALVDFVATVAGHLRRQDCLGRIGGEEFVLLLPETRAEEAQQVAERIRAAIQARSGTTRYTVSIGIAALGASDGNTSALLARADKAMYRAKSLGRNQVVVDSNHTANTAAPKSTPPTTSQTSDNAL